MPLLQHTSWLYTRGSVSALRQSQVAAQTSCFAVMVVAPLLLLAGGGGVSLSAAMV